jgi:uncharacterized protein (DUF305 family)
VPRCALLIVPLVLVALTGCGGVGGMLGESDWGGPNATDAAFVRGMAAHERAMDSIAGLGRRKAMRVELREIAAAAQSRDEPSVLELERFRTMLRRQRVSPVGSQIRAEPPPFDARTLRDAVSFDHDFLVHMIQQRQYAMTAAAAERDHGGDARLRAIARMIYKSSSQDLLKLRKWLHTWYGGDVQPGLPPGPPPGGGGGSGGGASPGPGV